MPQLRREDERTVTAMNNRRRQIEKAWRMQLRTRHPLTTLMAGIDWDALAEALSTACKRVVVSLQELGKAFIRINTRLNEEEHHD